MAASVVNDLEYKDKYRNLKRKLKFLIYENECFSMEIRNMEKRLLRVLKDRTFLLDILTQHENGSAEFDSTDDDMTDSSDGEIKIPVKTSEKKKRLKIAATKKNPGTITKTKKKPQNKLDKNKISAKADSIHNLIVEDSLVSKHLAGHMTPEEVERHLESRRAQQSQLEFSFAPDKAPTTVPTEMFSNDPEGVGSYAEFLDEMDTSPSNGGDEHLTVDMEHN
uniref:EOG090X0LZH n=1 Tax=Evadne anonyx TaxID=141404 RepID=A0A9N6ZFD0_9CRUS|nr:EOG090X0LZH [Evadne anonyx]